MKTKFILKSKEVWVLGIALIFVVASIFNVNVSETVDQAMVTYTQISPAIALVMRIFFTNSKITLSNEN